MNLLGVQLHDTPPESDSIDILALAEIFFKRKRFIFCLTLAGMLLAVCCYFLIPKKFNAIALLLPPKQDQGLLGLMAGQLGGAAGLAGDILGKGSASEQYVGMLDSEAVKNNIIDQFELISVYGKNSRFDTYDKLDTRVNITAGKKDGIIRISVLDKDSKRAAAMANAYVAELEKMVVRLNISSAAGNKEFLEERLVKAKVLLAKAEEDLKRFQSQTKAFDITEQTKGTIKGIADLMAHLAVEEVKLSSLLRVFTESSFDVKNQRVVIAGIKSQIDRLENGARSSGVLPSINAVPGLGQDYLRLMREFKIQETIVELLNKQYEIAKLSEAKQIGGVQVIQLATVADKHITPKPKVLIIGGTLASFLVALCVVYIQHIIGTIPAELKHRLAGILKSTV